MPRLYSILLILAFACACKKSISPGSGSTGTGSTTDTSVAITAVGTPVGTPVTKTIGAAGGTISSADGRIDLIIPPGALSSDLAITIQPITNECPGGLGAGYDFLPNGTKFSTPATLIFHYADSDVNGTDPDLIYFATQDSSHAWDVDIEKDLDTVAKTISFDVHHFSGKGFLPGLTIFASGGKLDYQQSETGTLILEQYVKDPELAGDPQSNGDDDLPPLPVSKPIPTPQITSWTVVGGSQNGTISGSGNQVTYTAPAKISTDKTILVSVTVKKTIVSKSRKQVMTTYAQKTVFIRLNLHPPVLSFSVQLDVTITGTSEVYNDLYHDGATFQVDINGDSVTLSKIVNQAPTVTPPYASGGDGTAAKWIPDSIGVLNITGKFIAVAYDTANGNKNVAIYFAQSGTVTPSWSINSPINGKYIVNSAPVDGFPPSLIFTTSNQAQTLTLTQFFGTGSPITATYVITPLQ
jgi:hypothetical protein